MEIELFIKNYIYVITSRIIKYTVAKRILGAS